MSDLISKKELYRKLGEVYNKGYLTWGANEIIRDIIGECDSVENKGDLISRQAVLELATPVGTMYADMTEEMISADDVRKLPSVQPINKWIPVSERLPEDHKDVLICLSSDQICIGCYNSHRLPFSNNAIGWGASYTHNWCSNDVIAWMPLPEPYKAEKGGE